MTQFEPKVMRAYFLYTLTALALKTFCENQLTITAVQTGLGAHFDLLLQVLGDEVG